MKKSNKKATKEKFTIEKFEVAKLTNLKKIKGGEGGAISDENKTGDLTTTIIQDGRQSTGLC